MTSSPVTPPTSRPFPLFRALAAQARAQRTYLLWLYLPAGFLLTSMFAYGHITGFDLSKLTQDPLAVVERELLAFHLVPDKSIHTFALLELPLFTGLLANIGALLWCSAVSVLCLAYALSRGRFAPPFPLAYLLSAALLTAILLLDDFFRLHERALPRMFIQHQAWVYLCYGLLIAAHGRTFFRAILASDFLLLLLAITCFLFALMTDALPQTSWNEWLEDNAKFLGIVSWAGYHWRLAWQQCLLASDAEPAETAR